MDNNIGFISLGCAKATYDTERLLTRIRALGYNLTGDYQQSDLIIINTCGFIEDAINESLEAIGEALDNCNKVIVTGCLGAKKSLITDKYPTLLSVTPPDSDEIVLTKIAEYLPIDIPFDNLISTSTDSVGVKLTPKHYAWLKIAEGCNQKCSFCIIPSMRGKLSSRSLATILREAENLVKSGVKELLIVAQDTMAYGVDIKYRQELVGGEMLKTDIITLAQELGKLGVWVRLHYLYPYPKVDKLVELMADGVILPYLDIPLQHTSHKILKTMHRPANIKNIQTRIKHWRSICPDIHLRTTMIVGFPDETDNDFSELCDFVQTIKFDRLGVFGYSNVKGASANNLPNHVDEDIKNIRLEMLMNLQQDISFAKLQKRVDGVEMVMVDELFADGIIARSKFDAPEIDGSVHIHTKNQQLKLGDFTEVKITANDAYDLEGVLLL